jgi:hypothetical protein
MNGMQGVSATARAVPMTNGSTTSRPRSPKESKPRRKWLKSLSDRIVTAALLVGLVCCLYGVIRPDQAESATGATPVVVYTVQPGDTLWDYASSITPADGDVNETVDTLVRINNLDSVSLRPGQRLLVPER